MHKFSKLAVTLIAISLLGCPGSDGSGTGGGEGGGSGGGMPTGTGGGMTGGTGGGMTSGTGGGTAEEPDAGTTPEPDAGMTPDSGTPVDMVDAGMPKGDLIEVATAEKSLSILVAAVEKAGLTATLKDATKKYTVFAPTNDAFAELLKGLGLKSLDQLSAEQLKPILTYHVLGTEVRAAQALDAAAKNAKIDTLGGVAALSLSGKQIQIDARALVTQPNLFATNGVIHVVDTVLLPSITDVVTTSPQFGSLKAAVVKADEDASKPGLVAALDNDEADFTLFTPSDDAFKGLLKTLSSPNTGIKALTDFSAAQLLPILKYHVHGKEKLTAEALLQRVKDGPFTMLGGTAQLGVTKGGVTIDKANVKLADLYTSNGVVHVIDAVMLPSILDVVTTSPRFATLAKKIAEADAVDPVVKYSDSLEPKGFGVVLLAPLDTVWPDTGKDRTIKDVLNLHTLPNTVYQNELKNCDPANPKSCRYGTNLQGDVGGNVQVKFSYAAKPKEKYTVANVTSSAELVELNLFCESSFGVKLIHVTDKVLKP